MTAANTLRDERDATTVGASALAPVTVLRGRTAVTGRFKPRTGRDKHVDTSPDSPEQRCVARFDRTFALTEIPVAAHTLYQQANAHFTNAQPVRRGPLDTGAVLHRTQHRVGVTTEGP